MQKSIKELTDSMPQTGKIEWIGLRPERGADLVRVDRTLAVKGKGLEGDHYAGGPEGKRQVTLIQSEHLRMVGEILGSGEIDPGLARRNIVVSGINLLALHERHFKIGEAELYCTGYCHPCSRMEANLGEGGYNAMRGHGGITCQIVKGGEIALGDRVTLLPED